MDKEIILEIVNILVNVEVANKLVNSGFYKCDKNLANALKSLAEDSCKILENDELRKITKENVSR